MGTEVAPAATCFRWCGSFWLAQLASLSTRLSCCCSPNGLGVSPAWGRIPSLLIAITTTWWLHRHFTFAWAREVKPLAREWLRFALVDGVGNGANLALYWLLLDWFRWGILIALTVSSVVAAGINYGMTAQWVFRRAEGDRTAPMGVSRNA
jgi:putative flippase GtrA